VRQSVALLETIRSRGHWRTLIRPRPFRERIPDIDDLLPVLEQARVGLKSGPYPVILAEQVIRDHDFIEQCIDAHHHLEILRFYQSGQFLHYEGFGEDWRDRSKLFWPPDEKWAVGDRIGIGATIAHLTGVFEFAARLASAKAGGEVMTIAIEMNKIGGRHFYVDSFTRFDAPWERRPTMESFRRGKELNQTELMADPRKYALEWLVELFKRVPSGPSLDVLKGWQEEFTP
jgi:hypothetical protein